MNWFIFAIKNTFNFKGRARRLEFGWYNLIVMLISLAVSFITGAAEALGMLELAAITNFILGLAMLPLIITSISLTTRRLHDLGYSGWWQLFPVGLAIVLVIVFALLDSISREYLTVVVYSIGIAVGLIYLVYTLVLYFKDGQRFENQYGKDPKASSEPAPPQENVVTHQTF